MSMNTDVNDKGICPSHWDTVTGQECVVDYGNHIGWSWIRFAANGRPRTRRADEVITLAERQKQVEERYQRSVGPQALAEALQEVNRRGDIIDLMERTLAWLLDNEVIGVTYTYNREGPLKMKAAYKCDYYASTIETPKWVLDVLAIAKDAKR